MGESVWNACSRIAELADLITLTWQQPMKMARIFLPKDDGDGRKITNFAGVCEN